MSQARRRARQAAVQAVYQWQMTQQNIGDIDAQFRQEHAGTKTDVEYFERLLRGVTTSIDELDELFSPYMARGKDDIGPVEKAVLRVATYELKYVLDVPYRVVINEAIDLGKRFGADKAHKFINGVLDKVVLDTRQVEINASKRKK